jgi:hypothetical protein
MSARSAKRLFTVLAAMLFALHVQAMEHVHAPAHQHAAVHASSGHDDGRCGSGCCSSAACCVQAVATEAMEVPERHPTSYRIVSQRAEPLAAVSPPDPPPRSFVL